MSYSCLSHPSASLYWMPVLHNCMGMGIMCMVVTMSVSVHNIGVVAAMEH